MGLCTEFGPSIRHDCDAPMVPGAASCSCPVCGAVCTGRFAGCSVVWERGPRPVALRQPPARPTAAPVPPAVPPPPGGAHYATTARTNGSSLSGNGGQPDAGAAALDPAGSNPNISGRVDGEVFAPAGPVAFLPVGVDGADLAGQLREIRSLLELLPQRIAAAMGEGLALQHRLILADVQQALKEFGGLLGVADLSEPEK